MSLFSKTIQLLRSTSLARNAYFTSESMTSRCRFSSTKTGSNKTSKGIIKIGLAGVTVGAIVGTGYSINYMNQPKAHILNEETIISPIKEIPDIVPSKSVSIFVITSDLYVFLRNSHI